jgi:hypothetical protein
MLKMSLRHCLLAAAKRAVKGQLQDNPLQETQQLTGAVAVVHGMLAAPAASCCARQLVQSLQARIRQLHHGNCHILSSVQHT